MDGIAGACRLRWVPAHGALYLRVGAPDGQPRVSRYDSVAGRAWATPHHAIGCSTPGGRVELLRPVGGREHR